MRLENEPSGMVNPRHAIKNLFGGGILSSAMYILTATESEAVFLGMMGIGIIGVLILLDTIMFTSGESTFIFSSVMVFVAGLLAGLYACWSGYCLQWIMLSIFVLLIIYGYGMGRKKVTSSRPT